MSIRKKISQRKEYRRNNIKDVSKKISYIKFNFNIYFFFFTKNVIMISNMWLKLLFILFL